MNRFKLHIRQILLLGILVYIPLQDLVSQHISKNNYTGNWESSSSWNPNWPIPLKTISGYDITINGFITANGSLNFTGSANNLIINDTLLVYGDLTINNNNLVIINDNGILILRGNMIMENQSSVTANGYFVIAGNYIKTSALGQGSFISNDTPVKVFVGGSVSPIALSDNRPNFPVLNCSEPVARYPNSSCSYGNLADLGNDPLNSFFVSTCISATAGSNSPVCSGSDLRLTASSGTSYLWTGPNDFKSTIQNPTIPKATSAMSGTYNVTVSNAGSCLSTASTNVTVIPLPEVRITSSGDPMCSGDKRTLSGTPSGGTFSIVSGPGAISGNTLTASGEGMILIRFTFSDNCSNSATQEISVNVTPIAKAGPDQFLEYEFETEMAAVETEGQRGIWSLVSGSGRIEDIKSPVTKITELGVGRNIFRWTVYYGSCTASDDVRIIVDDPFIPNVITPNGDGKNDYFKIKSLPGRIELIVINRWGITEYSNSDYKNDWDGKNDKGDDLKEDTYFIILNFERGMTRKGTVLIMR